MNVNFLLPVTDGLLTATAVVLQHGRRIIVGTADVRDDAGRLVACGRATYIINRARNAADVQRAE